MKRSFSFFFFFYEGQNKRFLIKLSSRICCYICGSGVISSHFYDQQKNTGYTYNKRSEMRNKDLNDVIIE